jgi:hypothetical protein
MCYLYYHEYYITRNKQLGIGYQHYTQYILSIIYNHITFCKRITVRECTFNTRNTYYTLLL